VLVGPNEVAPEVLILIRDLTKQVFELKDEVHTC